MMVSVRLPIPGSSGRVSTPRTSTLRGPSASGPPPPNTLSTQLPVGPSLPAVSGPVRFPSVLSESGPAANTTPINRATETTGSNQSHQRRTPRRSLVLVWKLLIPGKSNRRACTKQHDAAFGEYGSGMDIGIRLQATGIIAGAGVALFLVLAFRCGRSVGCSAVARNVARGKLGTAM